MQSKKQKHSPAASQQQQHAASGKSTAKNAATVYENNSSLVFHSLADRLNPKREGRGFDPELKAKWKTLGKRKRKQIIAEVRRATPTHTC